MRACRINNSPMMRCHTPLIEICDNTSQIKLDLGSCGICATKVSALLLRKGGCIEYEVVCEPSERTCCNLIDRRPVTFGNKRAVPKPKPSILYPLHEVDPEGMSVFVLDGKLKKLGYGRYIAYVLIADDGTLPANRPAQEMDYKETGIVFEVDYIEFALGLNSISVENFQPNLGGC